jgi:hypothetical protein
LIVLEVPNRVDVDFMHVLTGVLWGLYQGSEAEGDVLRFSIWLCLARERIYGRDRRNWFTRECLP